MARFWRSGVLTALMVGCGGDPAATVAPKEDTCGQANVPGEMAIVRFPYTITVDGKLDEAAWSDPLVIWQHVVDDEQNPADSEADLSYDFAVLADSDNLYIGARVKDDVLHADGTAEAYKDDALEVYVDAGNEKNDTQQPSTPDWLAPGPDDNDAQWVANIDGDKYAATYANPLADPSQLTAAPAHATADGYTIELALPLALPNKTVVPEEGTVIGLQVAVDDDDNVGDEGGEHQAFFSNPNGTDGGQSWHMPAVWGTATFCGQLD